MSDKTGIPGTTGAEFGDACRAYSRAVRRAFPPMTAPDATAALRDDLTHALGSDHLADLALRVIEPALLAVEVDTAQRMQGDVDRERRRAEAWEADARRYAGNADHWRQRAEAAAARVNRIDAQLAQAKRERDEQRKRAEQAEAGRAAAVRQAEEHVNISRQHEIRREQAEQRAEAAEADLAAAGEVHAALIRERDAFRLGPGPGGTD